MINIETEIITWLENLLATELFPDPAGGTSIPMVKEGDVDPKRSDSANEKDFPFVIVRTTGGSTGSRDSAQTVQLIGGIWTGDDVQSGFDLIKRLNGLLLTITKNRGAFSCRLSEPTTWYYGLDADHGQHPHPYYYVTITLSFVTTGSC